MDGFDSKPDYQLSDSTHDTKMPSPYIVLNCIQRGIDNNFVGIELIKRSLDYFGTPSLGALDQGDSFLDYFMRSSPGKLLQCKSSRGSMPPNDPSLFYDILKISLDHIPFVPYSPQQQFTAILPSLIDAGFAPSEKYPDAAFIELPSVFPLNFRPEGWNVVLDLSRLFSCSNDVQK